MEIIETGFRDLLVIKPDIFKDKRGYFFESYNRSIFFGKGLDYDFVQDNQSRSVYGVVRGLHYQLEPFAQSKLVRVLTGKILDIVVDIRTGSPTFGKCYGIELSDENNLQLMIPKGFAHGFSILSAEATVLYKTDMFYRPSVERGILYNDPALGIDWKIDQKDIKVSARDMQNSLIRDAEINFSYKL